MPHEYATLLSFPPLPWGTWFSLNWWITFIHFTRASAPPNNRIIIFMYITDCICSSRRWSTRGPFYRNIWYSKSLEILFTMASFITYCFIFNISRNIISKLNFILFYNFNANRTAESLVFMYIKNISVKSLDPSL